jgi:cytochrome c oxidase subunit 1
MYNLAMGQLTALIIFVGFNLTFFPQFIIGSRGMPRRYFDYSRLLHAHPEFTFYQIISTIGGYLLVSGLILVAVTLFRSLFVGPKAPANPWDAATLEWQCDSPPPHENPPPPRVVGDCYDLT